MKRLRKKMSFILFCLAMSFLFSSCAEIAEGFSEARMETDRYIKSRNATRRTSGYDPSWDIMQMRMERELEKSERATELERLKTHFYIQGLRRRLLEQQAQRELDRLNQKRSNR